MNPIVLTIIESVVVIFVLATAMAYMTWFERKVVAYMQVRLGPNRVGIMGLMQPAADGIKLAFKESIVPRNASKLIYTLAPAIAIAGALSAFAVVPVGLIWTKSGALYAQIANLNVGILFVFAMSSMNVYAIVLGGWSANSKYSLLGGLRAAAQLISYEMSLGLSVIGVIMIAGSLRLQDIVNFHLFGVPFPLIVLQPLGFFLYLISAIAETNRAPFDLPEAEQELTAGYHTEYTGFKFALYYMAEYINMITVSCLASILFLAGWQGPLLPPIFWFLIKVIFFLFLYVWIRATLPRLRYDALMRLGWKVLLPLSMLNLFITAIVYVAVVH